LIFKNWAAKVRLFFSFANFFATKPLAAH
jgi:hypothetical protein